MAKCERVRRKWHHLYKSEPELKMNKSHLYDTLKDHHYGEILKRLNNVGIDGKLGDDGKELGLLFRILWRRYDCESKCGKKCDECKNKLIVHDTKTVTEVPERHEKAIRDYEKKNNVTVRLGIKFDQKKDTNKNYINNSGFGVFTDLLYDTYLKEWAKAYQSTFHEFFHNIDHLAYCDKTNSSNTKVACSYSARYFQLGKTVIKDVRKLDKKNLDEIHSLPNQDKEYLYDIIGGALYYGEYGCDNCSENNCHKEPFLCKYKKKDIFWGHDPSYWLNDGIKLYLLPKEYREKLIEKAKNDKNEVIKILEELEKNNEFKYENRDKLYGTDDDYEIIGFFKWLVEIAGVEKFNFFKEAFKKDESFIEEYIYYDTHHENRQHFYDNVRITCMTFYAFIAAKAAIKMTERLSDEEIDIFYDKNRSLYDIENEEYEAMLEDICKYFLNRLALETFANMASVAIVNPTAFKVIKKYLPRTYEMFIEILEMMALKI